MTEYQTGLSEQQAIRFQPLAERLAGRVIRSHAGFRNDEQEDIAQELLTAVTECMPHFDPGRSSLATYVNRVMRHRGISLMRKRNAAKRSWKRNGFSLDDTATGTSIVCDELASRRHTGASPRPAQQQTELRMDFEEAIQSLPSEPREYAELRMNGLSHEAAQTKLGRSRREADRDRNTVLRRFEDKRLQEYL